MIINKTFAEKFLLAALLAAAVAAGTAGAAPAGELWEDQEGITVDSANRNADAIRRAENRDKEAINPINDGITKESEENYKE